MADEVNQVGSETEWKATSSSLSLFHLSGFELFHVGRGSWVAWLRLAAVLEPWVTAADSPCALAEGHRRERLELCLVEGVGKERVRCVVRGEPLLEQEKIVDVVEDAMEIRAQEAGGNEACIFAQVRGVLFPYHLLEAVLVELPSLCRSDGGQALLAFRSTVNQLPHPSRLQQKGNIWIYSFLLKQEVVCLLEVLESKGILRELAQVHYQLAGHVELDTTAVSFLVSLEDHVHEHFQLRDFLFGAESLVATCRAGSEGVALGVVTLEDDLALVEATSLDERVESVKEYGALRERLRLTDKMLTRDLDATAVEVGEERTQLLKVHCLITRVDRGQEEVLEVFEPQQSFQDAFLPRALSQEVCRETRGECLEEW